MARSILSARRVPAALRVLGLLAVFAPALPAPAGAGEELVVDLSETVVAITAGFSGTELLLYGVGEGDVIVEVRGPFRDEVVRRKSRTLGIWVNQDKMVFEQAPSFYAVAGNRPIGDLLSPEALAEARIGPENLDLVPRDKNADPQVVEEFRQALVRNKQRQGLYSTVQGNVTFKSSTLFRTRIRFPANVPVGTYGVNVYLVRDGNIIHDRTTLLNVRKFGIEASTYDFAHRHSLSYGVLAVLIAAMAGWLANVIFRKA